MEYFVDNSIDEATVNGLFKTFRRNYTDYEMHTFQLFKGGKNVVRISAEPYTCSDAREVYSLSKTFTSTVVGIASDMGLLSDEDSVCDYFPEINTKGFEKLKIKHLLSMNTGHESCVMEKMIYAKCSAEGFFSVPLKYEPGTHFTYNTGATCLLASIIEKVSGEKFFDFACEKLFYPLGITNVYWSCCGDGVCQAGTGLHISSDDISKLGIMYYNKGVFGGRRIVSEEWINKATSPISDNSLNGSPDWTSGYGYQIWINSRGGYRGDGAFGQLMMIIPEKEILCVVQGLFKNDMQREMDELFKFFGGISDKEETADYIDYAPAPGEKADKLDFTYNLCENVSGFKKLGIFCDGEVLKLSFSDGYRINTITAGNGKWLSSGFDAYGFSPRLTIMNNVFENVKTASCFSAKDNEIKVYIRYLTNPHSETLHIKYDEKNINFGFENLLSDLRVGNLDNVSGVRAN